MRPLSIHLRLTSLHSTSMGISTPYSLAAPSFRMLTDRYKPAADHHRIVFGFWDFDSYHIRSTGNRKSRHTIKVREKKEKSYMNGFLGGRGRVMLGLCRCEQRWKCFASLRGRRGKGNEPPHGDRASHGFAMDSCVCVCVCNLVFIIPLHAARRAMAATVAVCISIILGTRPA